MTLDEGVESILEEVVIRQLVSETQSTRDRCVTCKKETEYEKSTPVSQRKFYDGGIGQLCEPYYRIYCPDGIVNGEF